MPIPIIAGAAVVGVAAYFMSGCESQKTNPCDGEDCSGHGECLVVPDKNSFYCLCDPGYARVGNRCEPSVSQTNFFKDAGSHAPADAGSTDTASVGQPSINIEAGNTADVAQAEVEIVEPKSDNPFCVKQECLSGKAYTCTTAGSSKESLVIDCADDEECNNGRCTSKPGVVDSNCGPGWKTECEVTDIYDVWEYSSTHSCDYISGSASQSSYAYGCYETYPDLSSCGSDKGYFLAGSKDQGKPQGNTDNWVAFKMDVKPSSQALFYRLDVKKDWFILPGQGQDDSKNIPVACLDITKPVLYILFGDDQARSVPWDEKWTKCVFQRDGIFSSAGITGSQVLVQMFNHGTNCVTGENRNNNPDYYSGLSITKARIWSCGCKKAD